ncbi:MAG: hypothetical protein PHP22_12240, partial [Oscillospiraceae bacterium]|nr:hypothetical protein [Oscillospiraceae bacterium]
MKKFAAVILIGTILATASCGSSGTGSSKGSSDNRTGTSYSKLEFETTEESDIRISPENLVIDNFQIDRSDVLNQHVTGRISDRIIIDATLMCSVDPESPGEASVFSGSILDFTETQRYMFRQDDWTMVESEPLWATMETAELEHYGDRDRYVDPDGQEYECATTPWSSLCHTERGRMIYQLALGMSSEYYSETDFEFADSQTAYEIARSYLEKTGLVVNDYYKIRRLPYNELETEVRLFNSDAGEAERFDVDSILPDGWTKEEDSNWITLYPDINGLPVGSFSGFFFTEEGKAREAISLPISIEVIVNAHGVDYVSLIYQFDSLGVLSSGSMLGIQDALMLCVQKLYSLSGNGLSEDAIMNDRTPKVTLDSPETIF